jgi:hypothetical protein
VSRSREVLCLADTAPLSADSLTGRCARNPAVVKGGGVGPPTACRRPPEAQRWAAWPVDKPRKRRAVTRRRLVALGSRREGERRQGMPAHANAATQRDTGRSCVQYSWFYKYRIPLGPPLRYLVAHTSAAITRGSLHRAFRVVRNSTASRNPASRNSPRKAPPSLAPATQANHSASVKWSGLLTASCKTSSAT